MDAVTALLIIGALYLFFLINNAAQARAASDSKRRLSAIETKVDQLLRHEGLEPAGPDLSEVYHRLKKGQFVKAVRAYREVTGAKLQTATDVVRNLRDHPDEYEFPSR